MATVKDYDPIIAILRSQLLANSDLTSFVGTWENNGISGKSIYPAYIDTIQSPVFPAITIYKEDDRSRKDDSGFAQNLYYIHGWVNTSPSDAAYLYNMVVDSLDLKAIDGLVSIKKVHGRCPLYESVVQAHYFMTEWLIWANQSLMYS